MESKKPIYPPAARQKIFDDEEGVLKKRFTHSPARQKISDLLYFFMIFVIGLEPIQILEICPVSRRDPKDGRDQNI